MIMNSKLFFRHLKDNILKYTVGFSALVHLIGIFLFPSWGTVPDLVPEKIIKIKTVVQQTEKPVQKKPPEPEKKIETKTSKPTKESEPIIPKMRKKTARVKSVKAIEPSPAVKNIPVPIQYQKPLPQPVKAMQQHSSIPDSGASLKKITARAIPSTQFNIHSPTRQVTPIPDIASPHPTVQRKHFTEVTWIGKPQTPRVNFPNSQSEFSRLKTASAKIVSATRSDEFLSIESPASEVKFSAGDRTLKANPLIRAKNIQPLNQAAPTAATSAKSFASVMDTAPPSGVHFRSPQVFDSEIPTQGQRSAAVAGRYSPSPAGATSLVQMAAIPSGFNEKAVNGNGETNVNQPSKNNGSAGGANEISAEQLGRIKMAFSTQIRTKIALTKYYPRTARRRGFEGEPVVAFTLGNAGNLMEVSINNPSPYKQLDEAALDAVKSASPYPPIPELLKMKTIRFKLPISFILEEP